MQNKELLSHLQKLMAQLQQLQGLQLLQLTNPGPSSSPLPEAAVAEVAASPSPVAEKESSPRVIEASSPPTADNPSPALRSLSPTADNPTPPPVPDDVSPVPMIEESVRVPVTEDFSPLPTTEDSSLLQEIEDFNFQRATEDSSPLFLTEEQANLLPMTDPFAPIPVSYSPTSTHTDATDTTSVDAAINSTINTDTEQLQPSTVSVASS